MPPVRQTCRGLLTEVLAADIVAYSRLIGTNEARTLAAVSEHRRRGQAQGIAKARLGADEGPTGGRCTAWCDHGLAPSGTELEQHCQGNRQFTLDLSEAG